MNRRRKVLAFLSLTVVLSIFTINTYASEKFVDKEISSNSTLGNSMIMPLSTYISNGLYTFNIKNGVASCYASVYGYSNTTRVSITMYLQKYSGGKWTNYAKWSGSQAGTYMALKKTKVVSSGTYRLYIQFKCNSESIYRTSPSKNY